MWRASFEKVTYFFNRCWGKQRFWLCWKLNRLLVGKLWAWKLLRLRLWTRTWRIHNIEGISKLGLRLCSLWNRSFSIFCTNWSWLNVLVIKVLIRLLLVLLWLSSFLLYKSWLLLLLLLNRCSLILWSTFSLLIWWLLWLWTR